jgi:RHS repeat-associated protein
LTLGNQSRESGREVAATDKSSSAAPTISLPKGGGAIRGIGEKFAANPVTGTGSMTVPIVTSPGRAGFGPQLSLSYDSGAGNGTYGFGWSLSLPAITRKTDKGLPQYLDQEESDVFLLSGAEDLVPLFKQDATGNWIRDVKGNPVIDDNDRDGYTIRRYRPRIESLFARIERWTRLVDGDQHWRSISKDNILTLYGQDRGSRIADQDDPERIFSWLICETRDDKGNVVIYEYKSEDGAGIDLANAHERNRGDPNSLQRKANRYVKRIRYGNRVSLLDKESRRPRFLTQDNIQNAGWMFEVVFDYGEHAPDAPKPNEVGAWLCRHDPFSSYRAGFEVRTYRLCQRVLMFHHFPGEPDVGSDCLVRSTEFVYRDSRNSPDDSRQGHPIGSFIASITQSGYKRSIAGGYLKKSLPPVEFEYSQAIIQEDVRELDAESLENLPVGMDGAGYQWVDLDGEGISGILTEQGGAWFYKRNLSPIHQVVENGQEYTAARFGAVEVVATKPATGLVGGQAQFLDLAGDGQLDLVQMDGPVRGFYERTDGEGWEPFRAFISWPNLDTRNPNLKFMDLTGDGHADIVLTEEQALTWHASLAEDGFGPAIRVSLPVDEERGPRLVFDDSTQSIYLADLSGDGLTDLVRIRNGEICYWPNLGYGRFGARVTMDNAPWFDASDLFDQRRIRLADIDGSGTTDIIYLGGNQIDIYRNQSGNRWNDKEPLTSFPPIDNLSAVQAVDLLGNGTACLVWSSPLLGEVRRPMRYIDLMGGQKPHLLVKTVNNLGAKTVVSYAPSTRFYLTDKAAGKPWITKLPFPVHCVERVTVTDKWRQTAFSSTYSYHHGYFDGTEREFRGFGRVEQVDVESYGEFAQGNSASPYITDDKTLYQPPVKTVTWYHTGALLERERILSQFEHEYFPRWFENLRPDQVNVLGDFQENTLPEPDFEAKDPSGATKDLSPEEWREALRACKGMMLRQEVYELDVEALEHGDHLPVKLFSTAYHNCHIRRLQPKALNPHAVFMVAESEAITYHYEMNLTQETVSPDPRVAHTLNLQFDEYANILQSVAVVYPRLGQFEDDTLQADALSLIRQIQRETYVAYTEIRFTNDMEEPDGHRLRVPCEVLTYELTGIGPEDANDRATPDPRDNRYFGLDELRRLRLSQVYQSSGEAVSEIPYHQLPRRDLLEKRPIEHVRMLFFKDDTTILNDPFPFGQLGRLGLLYETYKLALTDALLDAVFKDAPGNKLDQLIAGATARSRLESPAVSGYLSGAPLAARFGGLDTAGQYWIRSGIAGFAPDAVQHFYLPERYTDPFNNLTTLEYDSRDLFIATSTDALGNATRVTQFDFRVLAPREMQDINDNLSEIFFDGLGLPAALAVKGKGSEGDNLSGFDDAVANPGLAELAPFFNEPDLNETQARVWLANTTARYVYYFGEARNADGSVAWATHPACACAILREQHVSQLAPGETSLLQAAFEYSDGMGSVVVKKVQAEPEKAGQPLRWAANGKTILNNKGKPVKQYEPYFSATEIGHRFEEPREEGVTLVIYYDAVGRTVRTDMPDGSFSRVEFSPWHVRTFDQNDTVTEAGNLWFARRTAAAATADEKRAALLAAEHANTPALAILDSLGRDVISIAHNQVKDAAGGLKDEKYLTYTRLDAEGKPLWVRDARKNLVMQYITPPVPGNQAADPVTGFVPCYDIAGNQLFQRSMDAGDRWMLSDAAGKPMLAWDSRGHTLRIDYDSLQRPLRSFVKGADPLDADREICSERSIYGEQHTEAAQRNLRGRVFKHLDQAGVVTSDRHDFKGNLLRASRRLAQDYQLAVDWKAAEVALPPDINAKLNLNVLDNALTPLLENETFTSSTAYDAMSRPIQLVAPHSDRPGARLNVIRPGYNEANLLERVDVWLEQTAEPTALLNRATANLNAVANIDYDAKGQRTSIEYNEATHRIITRYTYDKETFRLIRLLTTRPAHPETDKSTLQDLSYTYDPVGNITSIGDDAQQPVFFKNALIAPSNAYVYDALYRLVRAEGREHAAQNNVQRDHQDFETIIGIPFPNSPEALQRYIEEYGYDPVGNILSLRHTGGAVERWIRRYQYALDSNQLLATRSPGDPSNLPDYSAAPGYSAKYTYDTHGNMTTMPHLPAMEWDFKDQLHATQRQVVNNGGIGEKTYYVYDAGGQRVRKVTETQNGARRDERIYLGGFEVFRKYNSNAQTVTLERETLHIMDDKQRIALVETRIINNSDNDSAPRQLIRYQFSNHLGSASLEADNQAQIISYEEYTPYGCTSYKAVDQGIKDAAKRYRYTGKERDEESGLYYHGVRYYAPWLERWVSADPAGHVDGPNSYGFTRQNPIVFVDRNGASSEVAELTEQIRNKTIEEELWTHRLALAREKLTDATISQDNAYTKLREQNPGGANFAMKRKTYENNLSQANSNLRQAEARVATAKASQTAATQALNKLSQKGVTKGIDPVGIQDEMRFLFKQWLGSKKGPQGGGGGHTSGGSPPGGRGGGTPKTGRGFGTVAGVVFMLITIGTSVYAVSAADDKVSEAAKIGAEFAVQGVLYKLAGGGPVGMIVTMVSGMYSDNQVMNKRHAEDEVVTEFLRKRVPSAFDAKGNIDPEALEAGHDLLFNNQPIALDSPAEQNGAPVTGGPAPAARVWRTDNPSPPPRK